jgi:hypothetical protein
MLGALSDTDRTRLIRLLGMLNSSFDAERANAGAMADRLVRSRNLTWEQVVAHVEEQQRRQQQKSPPPRRTWHDVIEDCQYRPELLSTWEVTFLGSIVTWQGRLTPKQQAKLIAIAERLGVEQAA